MPSETESGQPDPAVEILQGVDPWTSPSFSLRNRLGRVAWGMCESTLFRLSPRPLHALRSALLRLFGAHIEAGVHVYPGARIWAPWNLSMAAGASIGERAIIYNLARVEIGTRAVISQGAHLCAGTHDYNRPDHQLIARPIRIGSHAWICTEAFVGPGVTIPPGTVLGARGVLMRSPDEPWAVYAGNPARRVGSRTMQP
jgi:putative colanic acid biosynthesis acetyltransferase WcaF